MAKAITHHFYIALELEKCLSLSEEEDRIFAMKNVLAANVSCRESNHGTSDEIDEIELLILAEELLEKLADIRMKYVFNSLASQGKRI
ncbi:MAG: hypothetical protein RMX97_24170 [Nostoc sp. DedQUE11]|nr:hypothetical protein [Nostoc sp. DedQUE11]